MIGTLVSLLGLTAGLWCIRHGVRMWATERLEQSVGVDLREFYRQAP